MKNYSKDSWTPKKGLTTASKAGIVVILVVLVLGGVYFAPSLLTGSGTSTTSLHAGSSTSNPGGDQPIGLLSLFGYFSQMQMQESSYDHGEGAPLIDQHTVSYIVLGKATLNSTQYTKVKFSQTGTNNDVIAWFNPQGVVDRADIIGVGNYTGNTANLYSQIFIAAFSYITGASNNSTLISLLSKTSENMTSIGPTKLDVVTYVLKAPTPPFTSVTVRFATIPGTNTKLAVYIDENTSDNMETTVQILSLAK